MLEVGTGLGHKTALLSSLAAAVWSVDVVEEFVLTAAERLGALDLTNVTLRVGDGGGGWPDEGRFDAILVSAAARTLPTALARQLAPAGRMVLPLCGAEGGQRLVRVERGDVNDLTTSELLPVQFTELESVIRGVAG